MNLIFVHLIFAKAKYQAIALLNFTERMNLSQMVKDSTRIDNILDLVLTDCMDVIEDISNVKHDKLSDHDSLILELNITSKKEIDEPKKNFCFTQIPLYDINSMSVEKLAEAKAFLESKDWNNVTAQSLTDTIEETVMKFCELKSAKKVTKEGNEYKSKK